MFKVVLGVGLSVDELKNERVRQDVINANESVSPTGREQISLMKLVLYDGSKESQVRKDISSRASLHNRRVILSDRIIV